MMICLLWQVIVQRLRNPGLSVANSGWNATDGISATGTLESGKKLTLTAASANGWALKPGENTVGYNLVTATGTYSSTAIKFKTSPYLLHYNPIKSWKNGYIECIASYSTLPEPVEEYIYLRFIVDRLRLPEDFFKDIKEVKIDER